MTTTECPTATVEPTAAQSAAESAPASFEGLGLDDAVLEAVHDLGYKAPTPVQERSIPEVLAGRDLLAVAQTGTGKTAAFLLPTMNDLGHVERVKTRGRAAGCGPLMLVVTPTRELAQQIEHVCRTIAKRTHHFSVTVVGGVGYNPQRNALKRGCDILIATPGRLLDLMDQGSCSLDQVEVLVLDEADRMLDMGFLPAIRKIVAATREDRQTLLFSATLDESAVGSVTDLVHDPARVEIAPSTSTADTVDQYVLPVSLDAKNALLAQVLKKAGPERAIVFTRTKRRADTCCRRLKRAGISCEAIHGDRSQNQRERALKDFRKGKVDVLVATDVLARGIDISGVRYVVNFDVPEEPADYIHRIGRTGRAGDIGWSLTIVTEQDIDEFFDIEALTGKTADLYDPEGLELGEDPVAIDPDRVPAAKVIGKKAKKRRNQAKKRAAASRASRPRGAKPRPNAEGDGLSHAKRVKVGVDGDREGADAEGLTHKRRSSHQAGRAGKPGRAEGGRSGVPRRRGSSEAQPKRSKNGQPKRGERRGGPKKSGGRRDQMGSRPKRSSGSPIRTRNAKGKGYS